MQTGVLQGLGCADREVTGKELSGHGPQAVWTLLIPVGVMVVRDSAPVLPPVRLLSHLFLIYYV